MAFPLTEIKLTQNKITAALFNMIISQRIFDSGTANTTLADKFRVDGTLFGDTKLYYSFDIGSPEDWLADDEAADLLKLNRNKSGKIQSITMGVYKILSVTTDQYLSKQAFMREGSFGEYISYLKSSLRKIKNVYDRAIINSTIGTLTPSTEACKIDIVTPKGATKEETNRLKGQTIAKNMVVLRANIADNERKYNKLDYLRAYNPDEFIAVWNVEQHADLTKLDLPTIFHKDIGADGQFEEYDLPAKWFGNKATADLTLPTSAPASKKNKILISGWYDVANGGVITYEQKPSDKTVFLWAGDDVPYKGQVYKDYVRNKTVTVTSTTLPKEFYYITDETIAFVLVHREALPYMSGFETATEFFNQRSLTVNDYLIFGHNNLEFIEEYPRVKVTVTTATE